MINIYFGNRVLSIGTKEETLQCDCNTLHLYPSEELNPTTIPQLMATNTAIRHLVIEADELGSSERFENTKKPLEGVRDDRLSESVEAEELFKKMFSKARHISAGGGLVCSNEEGDDRKYLMIYRNNIWDLPKGKQEEGEEIEMTALREVAEECGVKCSLQKFLCTTHHIYTIERNLTIKHTYWYRMTAGEETPLHPQTEEGITLCRWFTPTDIPLNNMYASINEVLRKSRVLL